MLLKLLFFGGKGGVGKSTLSCAVALRLSERGKTLLLSVDPAHSLSGIMGVEIGEKGREIKKGLFALELQAEKLVEEYAGNVLSSIEELLPSAKAGIREYVKYLKLSPTALETAILDKLVDLCGGYSYVVVDSAPTGQMLRLFNTAHMVKGWFEFLHRFARDRERLERFMGRDDRLLSLIESRKEKVKLLLRLLKEKAVIFAVANEEKLSLQEAETIKESLKDLRVYTVLNRWTKMDWKGVKVPLCENPYGVEGLLRLNVDELLEVLEK